MRLAGFSRCWQRGGRGCGGLRRDGERGVGVVASRGKRRAVVVAVVSAAARDASADWSAFACSGKRGGRCARHLSVAALRPAAMPTYPPRTRPALYRQAGGLSAPDSASVLASRSSGRTVIRAGTTGRVIGPSALGSVTLVSSASDGTPADSQSDMPVVSLDGTMVAFIARAGNLGVSPGESGLFVKDLSTGQTRLLAHAYAFLTGSGARIAAGSPFPHRRCGWRVPNRGVCRRPRLGEGVAT